MRYRADIDYDTISAYALEECASAKVRPSTWTKSPALALRHARAMAAVIRASLAASRAERAFLLADQRNTLAEDNEPHHGRMWRAERARRRAVARLVAVEKEVERGK